MGRVLPSGTVTFLFTDIEGSTAWWDRHPEQMGVALTRHDAVLAAAIESHAGVVFSTGGDGVAAAFARALDALAAARAAQEALWAETWPAPVELRVRMGVHTGEAEERDGDYFGPPLNRAARLMALANGGEVLVSAATAEVAAGLFPEGVSLVDLGEWELRGFARPERVHQLVWPGVRPRPPAPRGSIVGNLPRVRRRLVGRDGEVAALAAMVEDAPLVTVTGVGGVGKTSLALAAAQRLAPSQADGAWFCELAAVHDPAAVARAVAETLRLRPQADLNASELVVRALTHQQCLLVLDNCEHVLDAAGELVEGIVESCPHVRTLATSREALGVVGERIVAVPVLPRDEAADLFRLRAAERDGGFTVDDAALVSDLCQQLDGLPLAIELAAARAMTMPMTDLVGRLGDRFRLLHGQRWATGRHRTLEATVGWSYDLLTDHERLAFDRLSVFSGGFTLAAAEAVCADGGLDAVEVDDVVGSLAEKSMVAAGTGDRYLLLETLRQYGEARLVDADEWERLRQAHLQFYRDLVVAAHDGLQGPDELVWWRRLQAEWANIRSAFTWAVQNDDIEPAATIATHLVWAATWHDTGEPMVWIETVGALPRAAHSRQWASILGGRAWAAWDRAELHEARNLGQAALDAEADDSPNLDNVAEFALFTALYYTGDFETARECLDRCMERVRAHGRPTIEATYSSCYPILFQVQELYGEAAEAARQARALAERTRNPNAIAWALAHEAAAVVGLGDDERAASLAERATAIALATECVMPPVMCSQVLTALHLQSGRHREAATAIASVLQAMRRKSAWMLTQQMVVMAALVLAREGATACAAELFGATAGSAAASDTRTRAALEELDRQLTVALGPRAFADLTESGQALSIEQAAMRAEAELTALVAAGD